MISGSAPPSEPATRSVYNCTFDDNDCGVRFNDYDDLTMMDCLFTSNDYGASRFHSYSGGNFDHDYNGFYSNIHDLYDEQTQQQIGIGDNSKQLATHPHDPHGAYAERFYLAQHNSPIIDGGSTTAGDAGMSTYTTSLGSREDLATTYVDIGYHYPLRLKPYLQKVGTDKITVMWHGDMKKMGYVEWGLTDNYGHLESDGPRQLGSIWIYEKELSGLEANTVYHYRVRHGTEYSADCTFRTAMSTGDSFRFIAYGDNRGGNNENFQQDHLKLVNAMLAHAWADGEPTPRFVLHCGDFVYWGGTVGQWHPHFFDPAAGLLRNTPVWPSIGNHEYNGDDDASNYTNLFSVPAVAEQYPQEHWYSFDYGNCHFTVVDTKYLDYGPVEERDDWFEEYSDQHNWLKADLEGSGAPWKFVLLHVPPYTHSNAHPYTAGDVTAVREELAEKVFNKSQYGVDAVFCGHNHFYEHSFKFYDGSETEGFHYIVTGGGGADGGHNPWATGYQQNTARHCADPSSPLNYFHYLTVDLPGGAGNPLIKHWRYRDGQAPLLVETVTVGEPPEGW